MKLYLANPIYDTVFKYLMEDERIARTMLSALLKKKVVKVEQRPHEYVNTTRNNISMFRIDFGATIREDNGHEHLVLIELQKTWLETETLRFRQYLGAQYSRKENIVEESKDKHALPMVAVYILDTVQLMIIVKRLTHGNRTVKLLSEPGINNSLPCLLHVLRHYKSILEMKVATLLLFIQHGCDGLDVILPHVSVRVVMQTARQFKRLLHQGTVLHGVKMQRLPPVESLAEVLTRNLVGERGDNHRIY